MAKHYQKRKLNLAKDELVRIMSIFGFDIKAKEITEPVGGETHRVFSTDKYIVKICDENRQTDHPYQYLANKIISDHMASNAQIINVLAYDYFEKTDFEVLVMERAKGKLLLPDFANLPAKIQAELFSQILDATNEIARLTFDNFGDIGQGNDNFKTFKEYYVCNLNRSIAQISDRNLLRHSELKKITDYVYNHTDIFDNEKSVFNHTDLHIGNVLYNKGEVTLIFDFDSAVKGPLFLSLPKIIGLINNMSQLEKRSPYSSLYKDKEFNHLYPILAKKLGNVLADPNIVLKLNLVGIAEVLTWISENLSEKWAREEIENLITGEIVTPSNPLESTYYGRTLKNL